MVNENLLKRIDTDTFSGFVDELKIKNQLKNERKSRLSKRKTVVDKRKHQKKRKFQRMISRSFRYKRRS